MDTGRFKAVQPEQLVRNEQSRAQAAREQARREARASAGRRTRVSGTRRGTVAVNEDGLTSEERARTRVSRNSLERGGRLPSPFKIGLVVVLLALVVGIAHLCSQATPVNVTINGTSYALRGSKTLATAVKESGLPLNPGDFISLKGSILERHAGKPFAATINDVEVDDPDCQLHDGDVIVLADGHDIVEEYDAVEEAVPFDVTIMGAGPIHTFEAGSEGVKEIRTGRVSGDVVEKETVEPQDLVETRSEIGVGNDKVIALTFDDGPSTAFTQEILDVLAANDAKATFFCVGTAVEDGGAELVREMAERGNQICSHSYNNAFSVDGDFLSLTADQQIEEVERGQQVLADVLGYEPARYVRVGSQEMTEGTIMNIAPLIDAEIGWTLDTGDWVYMPEDDIYDVLMSAKPGAVIRMHDGGDHQNVTAAALKRALPKLKKKGFSFITIDELMAYAA